MPARTGKEFLQGLKDQPREIWIGGERVGDVAAHPAFCNVAGSVAALYDLQHDPALRDQMTFVSPSSGERVGTSFLVPRTRDDLAQVRRMMKVWADYSGGMLGRAPDYLNRAVTAFAAAAPYCGENDPRFADNVRRYYELCRERDVCLTHTLINPQANRATGPAGQADPYLAAAIVRETDAGVVIRGARMLATLPVADEILVFPSTLLRGKDEDRPYAFAFAIPCGVPGLKFICRETFDPGGSAFDHPLASRFEEMDAVVIFEDVVVPWERIFLLRDVERCNKAFAATGAVAHMAHQVVTKNIAKTEFVLGIASLMVDAIAVEQFQHVQSKIAEIIYYLESMRAFARASEADAAVDPWGVMTPAWPPLDAARNMFTWMYPRMIEILQLLGASGMMARPTQADLESPLRPLIEKYFQAAQLGAVDRIKLFRLAWDAALSSFGSRQVIYERFFFGDPVRMQMATFASYDRQPYMERVRQFLAREHARANVAADGS
ncbi:MAG: 4-hydroxyphenylacetate 3-monooxygenase, oxygenase component [Bacillati bacterium ANGP1]|uniref:4-hydroxyphenylacetate 3-monooxygenase, oxygenase component n=1 Tax=Candidatus Segetimicrobium genomatis TaxID=2569760 RepID=A0A537IKS4_9BACT|nr:MAG: 4-hydroxyphenylacetate 3-monooxygenase, oxygenase component [Terrabacteria group bacterium ANGP1]